MTGEGWFVCVVVGNKSCLGKILEKLVIDEPQTPLQSKLGQIAEDIGKIGMYCALLTIHILFLRFFIERMANRSFDLFGGNESVEYPNGRIK